MVSSLAFVMMGSTKGRSALALARVVLIRLCCIRDLARLVSRCFLAAALRLSEFIFLPCVIVVCVFLVLGGGV